MRFPPRRFLTVKSGLKREEKKKKREEEEKNKR